MHKQARILITAIPLACLGIISCNKNWLDEKPEKALVVADTIDDFQAMLDNSDQLLNVNYTVFGELGSGDFFVNDISYAAGFNYEKNLYIWAPTIFEDDKESYDWGQSYNRIFNVNIVIEGIEKIKPKNAIEQSKWGDVKGGALFHRAFNFFSIAQVYCKPFNEGTASNDLGIPLRLEPDINIPSVRASVQQTYDQIIADLEESVTLLPVSKPISSIYRIRPNKAAAYAMLARVYLLMNQYDKALENATKSLQLHSTLLNYNGPVVNPNTIFPFPTPLSNDEILFYIEMVNPSYFDPAHFVVDSLLIDLYEPEDMRSKVFYLDFIQGKLFRGSYSRNISSFFSGLATDEVHLIRAECYARKGNKDNAMADLNTLLETRWDNSTTFVPREAINVQDALDQVLLERKKQLCFRAIRWSDLRRLNQETQHQVTLNRRVNGQEYFLTPNHNKYVLQIPPRVILLSNIEQNSRN